MASAASGYKLSLGADGPPGSYQDIDRLDCALVIGSNMADCHPILFLRLLDRQKQGAKIIVVDPRRTATAEKADLYLHINPGTDLALLNGLLRLLLDNGQVDEHFIAKHTEGWDELRAMLADYPLARVAEITGLRERDICTAAKWIGESPEVTSFWAMGLNQSTHGTWHTNAICNLHLATGKICRPGSGPFSLTGQPNAMGGLEVGYMSHALPGQRVVTNAEDRAFIEQLWGVPDKTIGAEPGLDAVSLFQNWKRAKSKRCGSSARIPSPRSRIASARSTDCSARNSSSCRTPIIRLRLRTTRIFCCPAQCGRRPKARWSIPNATSR
jgi:sulfite reductase (NADPH) flavoprotein alpha-component